jgi:glycosyltransferase involved in cell wall biosynthesis
VRIAVEGLGATVGPVDGAGRFLLGLLDALSRRDDVEVSAFVGPSMRGALQGLDHPLRVTVIDGPGKARRLIAQHATVPRRARSAGADAVLYLGNYAPLLSGPPAVAIVGNLLLAVEDRDQGVADAAYGRYAPLLKVRDRAYGRSRAVYRRFARTQIARRAAAVVAISRTLADALERSEPSLEGRVRVVSPPLDVARISTARPVPQATAPEAYFLAVGRPWAYRDYPLALEALAASALPHSLVILGEAPAAERRPLELRAAELGLRDRLRFAGAVSDPGALHAWYAGAAALVATSRLESFGQPLGEAMAVGTPVVAVRRTAFPEIVGDAGLLVEPSAAEIAAALQSVVRPAERERLAELGRRRAGASSWSRCADELVEICREAARASGGGR